MSYGVAPNSVRRLYRKSYVAVYRALVALLLLVSVVYNTNRARRHVLISARSAFSFPFEAASAVRQPAVPGHSAVTAGAGLERASQGAASTSNAAAAAATAVQWRHSPRIPETSAAGGLKPFTAVLSQAHKHRDSNDTRSSSKDPPLINRQQQPQHGHAGDRAASMLRSTVQPGVHQYNRSGAIPLIIHQNYLAGGQQLLADALKPLSHFRKEWWKSCQVHHPHWTYMLWDERACEELLQQQYPWFMDTWRALGNSTVLKSDAIRPFILEAFGGLYLDLDSECFTDVGPWLQGAQLVLQAEVGHTFNNAQMASVPGHPLWPHFQAGIKARIAAGKRWPIEATGPHLLTDVVRALTGNMRGELPGAYVLLDGSRLVAYGPRQWFTPCAWNDWACAVRVAREKPLMRAAGMKAVAAAAAVRSSAAAVGTQSSGSSGTHSAATAGAHNTTRSAVMGMGHGIRQALIQRTTPLSTTAAVAAGYPAMLAVSGVAGAHHFSGSWLGLDGSKSLSLRREGVAGVLAFLLNGTGFVQQPCRLVRLLPQELSSSGRLPGSNRPADTGHTSVKLTANTSMLQKVARTAFHVCWEDISAAVANDSCQVVSVRSALAASSPCGNSTDAGHNSSSNAGDAPCSRVDGDPQSQEPELRQLLATELELAGVGCQVTLVTPQQVDLGSLAFPEEPSWLQQQQHRQGSDPHGCNNSSQPGGNRTNNTDSVWCRSSKQHSTAGSKGSRRQRVLSRMHQVTAAVGVAADPFADPPVDTLDGVLAAAAGQSRVTLLILDVGWEALPPAEPSTGRPPHSSCCCSSSSSSVLDILNQLYLTSSTALQQVTSLALTLPHHVPASDQHMAFAAYQHLFQETGFTGFYHSQADLGPAAVGTAAGPPDASGRAGRSRPVLLGVTRIRAGRHHPGTS